MSRRVASLLCAPARDASLDICFANIYDQRLSAAPFLPQVEIATGKMSLSALQTAMVALAANADVESAIRTRISEEIVKSLEAGQVSAALRGELNGLAVAALEERLRAHKATIDGIKYYYVIGCGYVQANIIKVEAGRIVKIGSNDISPGPTNLEGSTLRIGDQKISLCSVSTPTMRETASDTNRYYKVSSLHADSQSWHWSHGQFTHSTSRIGNTTITQTGRRTIHSTHLHPEVVRITCFQRNKDHDYIRPSSTRYRVKLPGLASVDATLTDIILLNSGDIYVFGALGVSYTLVRGAEHYNDHMIKC